MLRRFIGTVPCCSVQYSVLRNRGSIVIPGYRSLHSFDRQRRLELFRNERMRQVAIYEQKIEKVFWTVTNETEGDDVKVLMNRNISTYRDCIKHISRLKADRTALAYTNDTYKSVLERLSGNGTMTALGYNCRDERHADAVNKAYWRTCAFILGAVVEESFCTDVQLIGPSTVEYQSGRFEYVTRIENLRDWKPKSEDLFALTQKADGEYIAKSFIIEPMLVSRDFAIDLFTSNARKQELIRELKYEDESGERGVIVYRMGDFVDITYGPLIPHTNHIGKFALTKIEHDGSEYRFSGVSVPKELKCSSYSWDLICNASVASSPIKDPKLLRASG